jgi:hypothetical protein
MEVFSMTTSTMNAQLRYFMAHQTEFLREFRGKYLVIKDEAIWGVFESPLKAYLAATKENLTLGEFLIQGCVPGPEAFTISIASHELKIGS